MQFRKVLVGVDFSASSLAAARWVVRHLAPDAEIVLLHVLREPEVPTWLRSSTSALVALHEEVAPSLRGGLRGLAELLDPTRVHAAIRSGPVPETLVAAAREFDVDLICVGQTRTRRGTARFGATTAQRVLARSELPLVVVSGTRCESIDRVLVAVHESSWAPVARSAWSIAQRAEARVDALHVLAADVTTCLRALHPDDGGDTAEGDRDAASREEARATLLTHGWLDEVLDATGVGRSRAATHVRIGEAGPEVVAVAHATSADLVVLGRTAALAALPPSREAAPGTRHGIGSTARFVAWASPCPTLVMPTAGVYAAPSSGRRDARPRLHRALRVDRQDAADDGSLPPAASGPVGPHTAA